MCLIHDAFKKNHKGVYVINSFNLVLPLINALLLGRTTLGCSKTMSQQDNKSPSVRNPLFEDELIDHLAFIRNNKSRPRL